MVWVVELGRYTYVHTYIRMGGLIRTQHVYTYIRIRYKGGPLD
jgi:hypothetical protein